MIPNKIKHIIKILRYVFSYRELRTNFIKGALLESGYLKSLELNRPVDKEGNPVPWYTYSAIDFIKQRLKKDFVVFEYGMGQSTLFYSKYVKACYGVDDNRRYMPEEKENINSIFATNKTSYIDAVEQENIKFDIIVIDGKYREECTKKAVAYLNESGVIILDNTDCDYTQNAISFLNERGFKQLEFNGLIPQVYYSSQTSVFYRQNNCFEI